MEPKDLGTRRPHRVVKIGPEPWLRGSGQFLVPWATWLGVSGLFLGPKMLPSDRRCRQDAPRRLQDDPRRFQDGSKAAPMRPKRPPRRDSDRFLVVFWEDVGFQNASKINLGAKLAKSLKVL